MEAGRIVIITLHSLIKLIFGRYNYGNCGATSVDMEYVAGEVGCAVVGSIWVTGCNTPSTSLLAEHSTSCSGNKH